MRSITGIFLQDMAGILLLKPRCHPANPNNYPNGRVVLTSKGVFSKGFCKILAWNCFTALPGSGCLIFPGISNCIKCSNLRRCGDAGAAPAVRTDKWEKDALCKLGKEWLGKH